MNATPTRAEVVAGIDRILADIDAAMAKSSAVHLVPQTTSLTTARALIRQYGADFVKPETCKPVCWMVARRRMFPHAPIEYVVNERYSDDKLRNLDEAEAKRAHGASDKTKVVML